jgi:PST family polysaccharide transporter
MREAEAPAAGLDARSSFGVAAAKPSPAPGTSYRDILRSTTLIGGATVVNVLVGIVRTKAMAMLLGPAGFGLLGVYSSIVELARGIAGLGINASGVRQIAASAASEDDSSLARTVIVLRRLALVLGLLGALSLVVLASPISSLTFGTGARAPAVALLSIAVFLRLIADGQGALIQGMRRISDLARSSILGTLLGTLASVPIVYWMGEEGIVPALAVVAGMSAATSWWYGRKVRVEPRLVTRTALADEALSLLKLGSAFMASGMLTIAAAYLVRLIVLRMDGLEAAGYYQAAWTVGGLYVGFILQAMGADFYPRLVGSIERHDEANRLVNEQTHVGMLLATPGVIATLTFAPWVIGVLYSDRFDAATDMLRWICLGMALRVMTWPMGYVLVAKNRRLLFFAAEAAWTVVNVGLSVACVDAFGATGAGIAFFGSYVFHGVMICAIARRLTGLRWSADNARTALFFVVSIAIVFAAVQLMQPRWGLAAGIVATLACSAYSLRMLFSVMAPEELPGSLQRLLKRLDRGGRWRTT